MLHRLCKQWNESLWVAGHVTTCRLRSLRMVAHRLTMSTEETENGSTEDIGDVQRRREKDRPPMSLHRISVFHVAQKYSESHSLRYSAWLSYILYDKYLTLLCSNPQSSNLWVHRFCLNEPKLLIPLELFSWMLLCDLPIFMPRDYLYKHTSMAYFACEWAGSTSYWMLKGTDGMWMTSSFFSWGQAQTRCQTVPNRSSFPTPTS